MFNPHIKFEMSTITCNEEMKGNALKCYRISWSSASRGFDSDS